MEDQLYFYKAKVVRVIDGDTIVVDLDLGLSMWSKNLTLRFMGLNAPEITGKEKPLGLEVKKFLSEKLPVGKDIIVNTYKDKDDKYGRLLATVFDGDINLNETMLEKGLVKLATY